MTEIAQLTWQDIPKKIRAKISVTARRGSKLLDKDMPGWHDVIDVGRLDMQDACRCVYGQLNAVSVFQQKLSYLGKTWGEDYYFGYELHDDAADWATRRSNSSWREESRHMTLAWNWLQEEWLREIHTRREAAKVADGG